MSVFLQLFKKVFLVSIVCSFLSFSNTKPMERERTIKPELNKLLAEYSFPEIFQTMHSLIYEQIFPLDSIVFNWVQDQARNGCVPFQYFLIKYYHDCLLKKVATKTQIEHALTLILTSLILTQQNVGWFRFIKELELEKGALETLNNLKKSYQTLWGDFLKKFEANFQYNLSMGKAVVWIDRLYLKKRRPFAHPVWVCGTSYNKGLVAFEKPLDDIIGKSMGNYSEFKVDEVRRAVQQEVLNEFASCSCWANLFNL